MIRHIGYGSPFCSVERLLQEALDRMGPRDEIHIEHGLTLIGCFVFPSENDLALRLPKPGEIDTR